MICTWRYCYINIIVVANKKGGVGKTTTTQNLATMFANTGKKNLAIVPTLVDKRKRLSRDVLELLNERYGEIVAKSIIRDNIALAEAPNFKESIFSCSPTAHGAHDYFALGSELLKRLKEANNG